MLNVSALLTVKPGKFEAAMEYLRELAGPTRAEPGVHLYVFGPTREPDQIAMMERYTDKDALKAHFASETFTTIGPKLAELLVGDPVSTRFTEDEG